jgi:hypothetical protein
MTDEFRTTDLGRAAFLVVKGHQLRAVVGRGRRSFVFAYSAAEDAASYYLGAVIPARAFASAIRDLKALLVSEL